MHACSCALLITALALTLLSNLVSALSPGNVLSKRAQATPRTNITTLTPHFFPEYNSERVKISYGPYTVPSMYENNGMREFKDMSTALPCSDCLIAWMQAGLEYADGTVANADTGMWLHHTVFSNRYQENLVCPQKRHGDRFFASGNERTPVNICLDGTEQAGYYIGPDDDLAMTMELMNMADKPRDAILTMTYEFVPSFPEGFDKVKSYWLDINGCGSSSFPAKPEETFEYSSPPWKSPSAGRVLFSLSHLHDGGTHAELMKNGEVVCNAKARYASCGGDDSSASSAGMEHISSISDCADLGSTEPGDEWSIAAYYDTTKHRPMTNMDGSLEPVMGISLVYVTETAGPSAPPRHMHHGHHGSRRLKIVLACGILAGSVTLMVLWVKIKGGPVRQFFPHRQQAVSLRDADTKMGLPLLAEEQYED